MKLTTLTIKGFKSFVDPTVVHFNDGVTGVVGPNGCGKSNIVDAIRWVLGEQSTRNLRSKNMENLIFNGTKARKASNRAEVTLTFENTKNLLPVDFTTVTISRVLYREGNSEYRLNNVACRLRDIQGLLMDTGISNDSYAIIELANATDIIANKDHIRRRLFEQAAGISKYKKRKKETLNKLNATQTDLNRVEDLLAEIENNLKMLERQAKKAERYIKYKDEYKELSIQLSLQDLSLHKVKHEAIKLRQEVEQGKKKEFDDKIQELELSIQDAQTGSMEFEQALQATQQALDSHMDKVRNEEQEKGLITERIKHQRERHEDLRQKIESEKLSLEEISGEIEGLEQGLVSEREVLSELMKELGSTQDNSSEIRNVYQEKKSVLEKMQAEFREMERVIYSHEREQAIVTSRAESLDREIGENKIQFQSRSADLGQYKSDLSKVISDRDQIKQKLDDLLSNDSKTAAELQKVVEESENLREELLTINRTLDQKKNEFDLTRSMVENLEGYTAANKFLKKDASWSEKAVLLADVIGCDPKYRGAIEYYLEDFLDFYVVPSLAEAQKAVSLLNDNKKGKSRFFLLDELSGSASTTNRPEGTVAALDLIHVESQYIPLFAKLLNGVYLTDDKSIAARKPAEGVVVLDAAGSVYRASGRLQGGSTGSFAGKRIGREKQLDQLQKEIEKQKAASEKLQNAFQECQAKIGELKSAQLRDKIAYHQSELNKKEQLIASFQAKIENTEQFIGASDNKNLGLAEELQELLKSKSAKDEEVAKMRGEKQEKEDAISEFRGSYLKIETELNSSSDRLNDLNSRFFKQENLVSTTTQEIQFKKNRITELSNSVQINGELMNSTMEDIQAKENNLRTSDTGLASLYEERERLQKEVGLAEKQFHRARGSIDEFNKKIRQTLKEKEQQDQVLNALREEMNTLQMDLLAVRERLRIEFQVELDELMENPSEEVSNVEELRTKVNKLQKRITNFGDVNPMAIEAYNAGKERYDFIQGQRQDLIEAKDSLMETIREIEETATTKFMEAFEKVNANFKDVFKQLFTEDDVCNLKLSDPENPLDSTVEIMARPKGKRPSTIDQLSGGEKTLTAISLIFGLYLLKPAPFCVLDEVDAPLDDNNLHKFIEMIRNFAKESQFIIVTHQKITMNKCHALYGVTMKEEGVSMLVPVDFNQLEYEMDEGDFLVNPN